MTAYAAGEAVQRAYNNVHICPLADGGEGTMEVMNRYLHGDINEIEVAGPLFKTVHAKLAIMDDLAIIESAQACGPDYQTEEEKNGTEATSYGVGEMMKYAYDHGVKRFLLTLGGSACNDGGIGLLSGMGYGFFDQFDQRIPMNVGMYYNSYSLPTYHTIWNPGAFIKTTLAPVIIMLVVNLIVIIRMMQHTPLQFLRHDLKKTKRKKAMRLPRWSFMSRFRMRIMFQNVANYLILFVGIFFIMVMLAMAVGMPDTLDYYKKNTDSMMFAKYQYVLKSYVDADGNVLETDNSDAEKFDMTSLLRRTDEFDEEVSVYGVETDSAYVKLKDMDSLKDNEVYISDSFADKYGIKPGDTIKLDAQYEKKTYKFKVKGTYDKSQSIAVFMPIEHFADTFDFADGRFSGFLSDTKIKDIDESNIATTITIRDITKMADQLDHSMGSYMQYFQVLCILLSAVMIYLLTKLIIEKNETAISMTKILGYDNREIASLYLVSTSIVVVISDIISVVLGAKVMDIVWRIMLQTFSGWFSFHMTSVGYVKMFAFVLIGYLIVTVFDFSRIKRIPMDMALKNVE